MPTSFLLRTSHRISLSTADEPFRDLKVPRAVTITIGYGSTLIIRTLCFLPSIRVRPSPSMAVRLGLAGTTSRRLSSITLLLITNIHIGYAAASRKVVRHVLRRADAQVRSVHGIGK